jgi:hypothetical protein
VKKFPAFYVTVFKRCHHSSLFWANRIQGNPISHTFKTSLPINDLVFWMIRVFPSFLLKLLTYISHRSNAVYTLSYLSFLEKVTSVLPANEYNLWCSSLCVLSCPVSCYFRSLRTAYQSTYKLNLQLNNWFSTPSYVFIAVLNYLSKRTTLPNMLNLK